jgi:hypothetical protein
VSTIEQIEEYTSLILFFTSFDVRSLFLVEKDVSGGHETGYWLIGWCYVY